MSVREVFDSWAADGRDKGMEERHWHTAKHVLARMPVEGPRHDTSDGTTDERGGPRTEGDTVLDLGTGSGYALRALAETKGIGRGYGLDGSPEMAQNAREYTRQTDLDANLGGETAAASATDIGFVVGDFGHLPFADDSIDHTFTMEAFYYSADPHGTLREVARVLKPGGTFHCAVNYYEENVHSHVWQEDISVDMTLWNAAEYRDAFREAGLAVATQDNVPDREIEIPPAEAFPTENWESREEMVERYRSHGTLLTVGVAR